MKRRHKPRPRTDWKSRAMQSERAAERYRELREVVEDYVSASERLRLMLESHSREDEGDHAGAILVQPYSVRGSR